MSYLGDRCPHNAVEFVADARKGGWSCVEPENEMEEMLMYSLALLDKYAWMAVGRTRKWGSAEFAQEMHLRFIKNLWFGLSAERALDNL